MVWRIATGKRTRQDDPELVDFTKIVVENFQNMNPSDPMGLVMVSSLSVTRLRQFLGLRNYLDTSGKIKDMIKRTIGESKPNENGNYIERALSEDGSDEKGGKTVESAAVENSTDQKSTRLFGRCRL